MSDKLKHFVQEHREEFDVFEPRPDLWQDISKDLQQLPPKHLPQQQEPVKVHHKHAQYWMRIAAAVAVIAAIGTFVLKSYFDFGTEPASQVVAQQTVPLERIAPELQEAEVYYTTLIQEKRSELAAHDLSALGLEEAQWKQETAVLDSMYLQLKAELLTNPTSDRVLDAMSQNLRLRMEILNRQLELIRRIKEAKNATSSKNHESKNA
ncbi:MAG: hypothetical protein LPJ89_10380 [Hymenobacteraceae bacterium]|nr:hypothetical protein [Hymenobacteraceae bacterium]